jgi:hypothetical protein
VRGLMARRTLGEATLVVFVAVGLALLVNALRPEPLPLVAQAAYAIYVPCPEPAGDADPIAPDEVRWGDPLDLVIDARPAADRQRWRAPGAVAVTYDFLDPVDETSVRQLVRTGADRVVVYGDGGLPDTGELLARELAGRGMRNVHFVPGGAPVLRNHEAAAGEAP